MTFKTHGSRESFFMERLIPMKKDVYYYMLSLLKNEQDAEDAVQEAMIVSWEHLEQLRDPESAGAWLMAIAKNKALVILNDRKKSEDLMAKAPERGAFFSAEDDMLHREDIGRLLRAIDTLPARYALLIRMQMAGMSPGEVREALQIDEGRRSVMLYRARKSLKKIMDKME